MSETNSPPAVKLDRWYLRCVDCLQVMAVEIARPTSETYKLRCGGCDGRTEIMGKVHRSHLIDEKHVVKCDASCVGAFGPSCDCSCNGANHGTRVTVVTWVDAGGIPRITPINVEKSKAIAAEWRAAVTETRDLIDAAGHDVVDMKRRGVYLNAAQYTLFAKVQRARRALAKINERRTHKGRMEALRKVAEAFQSAAPVQSDPEPTSSSCAHEWGSKEEAYEQNRPLFCLKCGACGDV